MQTRFGNEVSTLVAANTGTEDINLRLVVLSSIDPTTMLKSSVLSLDAAGLTFSAVSDVTWLAPLLDLLKTPPGAFADMKPSDKTYFNVSLADCHVAVFGLADKGTLAMHLKQVDCNSTLSSREGNHGVIDVGQITVRLSDRKNTEPSHASKVSMPRPAMFQQSDDCITGYWMGSASQPARRPHHRNSCCFSHNTEYL